MSAAWRALAGVLIGCGVAVVAQPVVAVPSGSEQVVPTVALSVTEAEPEELIEVTISGFSSRVVTVTVCGNDALRGSGDCNMAASESTPINDDGSPRFVRLIVSPPPVPCPCLIRVSSPTNDQAAVAPIVLTGHPTGPLVPAAEPALPLVVSIRADRSSGGLLDSIRASLGGPTAYDVTVTIRNTATHVIDGIGVAATAGRRQGPVLATVDVEPPASIAAGATWEDTVRVELPAPVWGNVRWVADVSGGGPTVEATDDTSSLPVLLVIATGVLLLVALALGIRLVVRVRNRRRRQRPELGAAEGGVVKHGAPSVDARVPTRELESV